MVAPLDYQPGQLLPGTVYRILRLIGVGGMGTVYDVEDTTIGKRYVVKTLHPKLGAREDLARRVMKEARTLARLNHPNIIEVITAGVTSDDFRLPYYVMERLNGQSLRMVIDKKGRLELSHAYHIGIDLLDALDHAHDKGMIHRDVKPDNIFLHRTAGGSTVTKLLDFGIVSVLDGGSTETAGRFLGTLRYAAPEQLRGESPTPQMDVYAAALVIYEIAAGSGPFDDQGDAAAVGAAHVNKLAPRLSSQVEVPKELDNLIAAALAKDPRVRPRDAFSFAASLRNLSRSAERARKDASGHTTVAGIIGLVADSSPAPVSDVARAGRAGSVTPPVSPRVAAQRSPVDSTPRPAPVTSTLVGMPALTVGPGPKPSTTVPEALDRAAATRSIDTDIGRVGPNGTEAVPALPDTAIGAGADDDGATVPCAPPTEVDDAIRWPPGRPPAPSEGPQVRSVPVALPGSRGALVAAGAGAAMFVLLGALALTRTGDRTTGTGPARAVAPMALPRPVEPEVIPAPTIAPPAFEPGELSGTTPRAVTPRVAPSASVGAPPAANVAPAPLASASPARSSPVRAPAALRAAAAADRPGPGF